MFAAVMKMATLMFWLKQKREQILCKQILNKHRPKKAKRLDEKRMMIGKNCKQNFVSGLQICSLNVYMLFAIAISWSNEM